MAAIITDTFKLNLAEKLYDEIIDGADSNEYYIGIGKGDLYPNDDTIATPIRTGKEEREARATLQSVKKISNVSFVIPRYNWSSGGIYSSFTDAVVGIPTNTYYVLTEDNEVYICLHQSKSAAGVANQSTVKPSFADAGVTSKEAFETADGYRWKLLYSLSATRANSFLSAGWIPIERVMVDSAVATAFELQQLDIQNSAVDGQIIGALVTRQGSGYTSAPTITFEGNGTGAAATATIASNTLTKIEMNNAAAALGSGYNYASVKITGGGGSGAKAVPIIAPTGGIGKDPRADLKSSSVMMVTKPTGTEGKTFVVDQDFRQIVVLKNPEYPDSDGIYTATSGKCLRYMIMNTQTNFDKDDIIRGVSSGAAAHVVDVDSAWVYYTQNEHTGFGSFSASELVEDSDGNLSGTISSPENNTSVDPFSGELLYIENRARVQRSSAQTEDIKVIITV